MAERLFGALIITLSVCGVVVNVSALVILSRKKLQSPFHQLLRILSVYDVLVVACSAVSYGIDNLVAWDGAGLIAASDPHDEIVGYDGRPDAFIKLKVGLMPIIHIVLMTSVYLTVLISLERYVRICFLCQLRESSIVTEQNLKYFKAAVLVLPVIFYLPKFFEFSWRQAVSEVVIHKRVDCTQVIITALESATARSPPASAAAPNSDAIFGHGMIDFVNSITDYPVDADDDNGNSTTGRNNGSNETTSAPNVTAAMDNYILRQCFKLISAHGTQILNFTIIRNVEVTKIEPTPLRANPLYYQIYCVATNSLVAWILPLVALIFLNIMTVRTLRSMGGGGESSRQLESPCSNYDEDEFGQRRRGTNCSFLMRTASSPTPTHLVATEGSGLARHAFSPTPTHLAENERRDEAGSDRSESSRPSQLLMNEASSSPPLRANLHMTTFMSPRASSANLTAQYLSIASDDMVESRTPSPCVFPIEQPAPVCEMNRRSEVHFSQERRLARISISIVWLFMFCHAWRAVPTFYEALHSKDGLSMNIEWPLWLDVIEHISHSLITFNSAVNFLIYVLK